MYFNCLIYSASFLGVTYKNILPKDAITFLCFLLQINIVKRFLWPLCRQQSDKLYRLGGCLYRLYYSKISVPKSRQNAWISFVDSEFAEILATSTLQALKCKKRQKKNCSSQIIQLFQRALPKVSLKENCYLLNHFICKRGVELQFFSQLFC